MSTYIKDFFPKPLLEDILKGECLPIIGSGFSLNADLPSGYKMPMWDDLGKYFSSYLPNYTYSNALDAISAYSHEFTRNNLIGKLNDILNINNVAPGETHKAFAKLPFKIVCTTNFDFLLEKSYSICKPIIEENQLSISVDDNATIILKIHGDLNHPSKLVVVEEDYDLFLERNPLMATYLSYLMIVKTPLFLGYSIDDPDFRQIFKVVNERLGNSRRPAYTIKINANQHEISKFERRGVKVINVIKPNVQYKTVFSDLFTELSEYWNNNVLKSSTFSKNETRNELLNIEAENNRICFFSIPFKYLALYKELIFPIVEKYGFIPLTSDEVISYGDTLLAKISAIINRAELIICDLSDSNNNVFYEFELATKQKNKRILVLHEQNNDNYIYDSSNIIYIKKDENLVFVELIEKWLKNLSGPMIEIYSKEPMRLFEKKEYRAAVISAFSFLEIEINKYLEKNNERKTVQTKNADILLHSEIINGNEAEQLKKWQQTRNMLAHTDRQISKEQTSNIMEGINHIIQKIRSRI
jgi:uncharacterized protein YutE (UPF0331/DUF86 family)